MASYSQLTSRLSQMYQKLQGVGCIRDYYNTKTEIEQKIDALYNEPRKFCRKCEDLKKYIIQKNRALQHCYNSSNLLPIESSDKIIKFRNHCPDSKCRYSTTPPNKPVILKKPNENPCSVNGGCKEKVATHKAQKVKTSPALDAEDTKARSPKVQFSPEEVRKHANLQESRQESENIKAKQDIKPSGNSVGSEHETIEPKVNSNTSPYGESEDKAQSLPVLANPANNELVTGLNDSASQTTPEGESDLSGTTEVTNLPINTIQSGPNSVQIVDNETAAIHSNGHLNPVTNFSCPGDSTEEPIGAPHTCPRTADRANYTEQSPDEKATFNGGAHSEIVDNGGITASSFLSEGNHGDRAEHSPTPKEDVSVMGSQVQVPNATTSCRGADTFVENDNGSPCNAENGSGLDTDIGNKSDIFSKFVDAISNKDHIIQASAPMGIVLLLTLLFKFTPMWRVLTKKNRNKGAGINEELNSVLKEPLIMDDERSIPFSYGAFEYSSFDQNVY